MAHTGQDAGHAHDAISAFRNGFSHPLAGLDHLAAMVALGVWSALTARRAWFTPLAFVAVLLAGAWLGMRNAALPAIEPMIASSLLVLGLLLATRTQLPEFAGATLAMAFALFHGAAHGQELGNAFGLWALAGMGLATVLLHAAGIGLGLALKRSSTVWLPRLAGTGVALLGTVLLLPALLGSAS
jgi:urease accessory protein